MGDLHPIQVIMSDPFPEIKSSKSLVAKYVTEPVWNKLSKVVTETSGFTLAKAIACAVEFDNQHCGIYAGDWDSYKVFADVFDPIIQDYHGISADSEHTSDMDVTKIKGNIDGTAPVHSTRIRVGRSIDGFGLSPGITKDQRLGVENLMKKAFANLTGDLAGTYYPLTGMSEKVRQQLVDDHFLFVSGDLPGWTKEGVKKLQDRCEELHLQPRGTRGESGGQTGITYDISNKHRLGYSEVELVQKMIDGVNTLVKEDRDLAKKHNL